MVGVWIEGKGGVRGKPEEWGRSGEGGCGGWERGWRLSGEGYYPPLLHP